MRRHPNVRKMQVAVDRWIEEASARPDGSAALAMRAAWMAQQIAILGRDDLATPPHLIGLTVYDLMGAQDALSKASLAQADAVAA